MAFTFDANNNLNVTPSGSGSSPVNENIAQWGGAVVSPASNIAGNDTRTMPDVRVAGRKYTQTITTTPLLANAAYISPWFDTNTSGAQFVHVTWLADQATGGAGNQIHLEGTDITGNASLVRQIGTSNGAVPANTLVTVSAMLPYRYWRLNTQNGAIAQGSLIVTSTEYSNPPGGLWASGAATGYSQVPSLVPIGAQAGGLTISLNTQAAGPDGRTIDATIGAANASNGYLCGILGNVDGTRTGWNGLRIPTTFKTAAATIAGNTAVWTPAAGKKFRLMRYQMELTENATLAVAALVTVKFQDNVTDFGFQHDQWIPAAAATVTGEAWRSGWIDIGNGYLSLVANNVLNFNIGGGANLTGGQFRVNVCGTEE